MFQIVEKKKLNDAVVMVRIAAPLIAKKVLPGQFIIFRLDEFGERVPLTVADYDREGGTITLISRSPVKPHGSSLCWKQEIPFWIWQVRWAFPLNCQRAPSRFA